MESYGDPEVSFFFSFSNGGKLLPIPIKERLSPWIEPSGGMGHIDYKFYSIKDVYNKFKVKRIC